MLAPPVRDELNRNSSPTPPCLVPFFGLHYISPGVRRTRSWEDQVLRRERMPALSQTDLGSGTEIPRRSFNPHISQFSTMKIIIISISCRTGGISEGMLSIKCTLVHQSNKYGQLQ